MRSTIRRGGPSPVQAGTSHNDLARLRSAGRLGPHCAKTISRSRACQKTPPLHEFLASCCLRRGIQQAAATSMPSVAAPAGIDDFDRNVREPFNVHRQLRQLEQYVIDHADVA